jgi:glycosyltransferase involved in cell wall biosynthesis
MSDDIVKYASDKVLFMEHCTDRAALLGYMRHSTALIHLCWTDCCPNSVVEAINQRCPVICNNEGGTHEIVRPSGGIVLDIDDPYDLQPTDLYNPPVVDLKKIADAMVHVSKNRPLIKNDHVDIKNVAQQYKKKFEMYL